MKNAKTCIFIEPSINPEDDREVFVIDHDYHAKRNVPAANDNR